MGPLRDPVEVGGQHRVDSLVRHRQRPHPLCVLDEPHQRDDHPRARVADLGGGFGIRHNPAEHAPDAAVLAPQFGDTAGVRLIFTNQDAAHGFSLMTFDALAAPALYPLLGMADATAAAALISSWSAPRPRAVGLTAGR